MTSNHVKKGARSWLEPYCHEEMEAVRFPLERSKSRLRFTEKLVLYSTARILPEVTDTLKV